MKQFGIAALFACSTAIATPALADFPEKPVQIVVPFAPGGAGDVFARVFVNAINDNNLLPQPMIVVNKPGGGTTIGSGEVKNADADGHTILQLHQTLITSNLMGTSNYGPEAFEPIVETHHVCLTYATSADSGLGSIADVKAADDVKEATLIGSLVHFSSAKLDAVAELGSRPVNVGGGAKRSASLLGGHTQTMFTMPFVVAKPDGGFVGLAHMGPERHPKLPDVPTAAEQGYDVNACINYWWFAPDGTPDDRVAVLAEAFRKAAELEAVKADMEQRGVTVDVLTGDALKARIAEEVEAFTEVAATIAN